MPSKWDCFQSRDLFGLRAVSSQCKWIQTTTLVFTCSFKLLLGSFKCSFFLNSVHSQGNVLPPFLFPWVSLVQLCANIFTCMSTKWGLESIKRARTSAGGCWQEKLRLESSTPHKSLPVLEECKERNCLHPRKRSKLWIQGVKKEERVSGKEYLTTSISLKETLQHFCSLVERTGILWDFLRWQCGGRAEVMETKKTDSSKYPARHFYFIRLNLIKVTEKVSQNFLPSHKGVIILPVTCCNLPWIHTLF